MGLSKDNTDVIEEIKGLELTTAQKRRLRRKKLKAARAGSLDTDSNIQKDILGLNTHPTKAVPYHQLSNKTQNSIFKETTSINNQKSKLDNLKLSNDLQPAPQVAVSKKSCKSTPKHTNYQELKGDIPYLITNQIKSPKLENPFTSAEEKPGCENLDSKKKEKYKLNVNHQIEPSNSIVTNNQKNKSDKLRFLESQTAVNQKLHEKQAPVSLRLEHNENQSRKLKDLSKINIHISSDVLINKEIVQSHKSETCSTKVENLKLNNQESESPKTDSIDNIASAREKQSMGKVQDTSGSQKKPNEPARVESKKEDTSSADTSAQSREEIKAAREAKKLAKQKAKKKDDTIGNDIEVQTVSPKTNTEGKAVKENVVKNQEVSIANTERSKTTQQVSGLKSKENIPPTDKCKTEDKLIKTLGEKSKGDGKTEIIGEKSEEAGKSKAELRAERRAKQEAQRAAKQETQRVAKPATEQKAAAPEAKVKEPIKSKEEKSPKAKNAEKSKSKTQSAQKVGWFQHLYVEKDKESLNNIPINSNLHPAVVKLGVQLATRVITGSNARCIALLDAIKKMVRDYSLPARTEVGRGLQAQLAAAAAFLGAQRAPAAAETNALKHFRRQLTQLPANIDEFDAKKQLQEEIDRYIREQIDMAGEAISLILRNKICPGDHILTYGCSSLIERVLCAAWAAGVRFRATVAGARGQRGPEMLRRLRARGVPASYVDISAISYVMSDVQKVVVGAGALLAHGAALGAAGSAQVALVARARNVPVLVACETHKFSERTHLDPLVCHEIGDPDELIDKTDPNSPLKDWRSNPNLTLLNVTYDVTPPSLITAVVTELGILPCTSAPVVLRFKQSEYGM